jgi:hypothetical protein
MSSEDKLAKLSHLKLTEEEKKAYTKWSNEGNQGLGAKASATLFESFLNGNSCQDIVKANPGYDLGLLVKTRIDQDWDGKKQKYIEDLSETVKFAVKKASLETIKFAHDAMSVFHRLAGDRFKKYLNSGKPEDLGPFADMSLRSYKDFVELFMLLTGQANTKHVTGNVLHTHVTEDNVKTINVEAVAKLERPLSKEEASEILGSFEVDGSEKK